MDDLKSSRLLEKVTTMFNLRVNGFQSSLLMLLTSLVLVGSMSAFGQDNETFNLEKAKQVWRTREKQIRSAVFTFVGVKTFPAGSKHHPLYLRGIMLGIPPSELPTLDEMTYEVQMVVKLDGNKVRVLHTGPPPIGKDGTKPMFETRTSLETFDGEESRGLVTLSMKGSRNRGFIRDPRELPVRSQTIYMPLLLTYRAFAPQLTDFDPDKLLVTGDTGMIDGRRCFILKAPGFPHGEYWVSPSLGYCILRQTHNHEARLRTQVDISYKVDDEFGPVPQSWTVQLFVDEKVAKLAKVTVSDHQFNVPIPALEFSIFFPVGTIVADQRGIKEKMFIPRSEDTL